MSGDITLANGQKENIYSDTPQAKPVTSLLPVPTPWTSKGLGSAIPDSQLGAPPTYSVTSAENTITPTNSVSFPSMTSSAEPTGASVTLNVTGFPAYPTASMGEPYGYGPPPEANTTTITPSTGFATANRPKDSHSMLCLMLLAWLMHTIPFLSGA